MTQLVFKTVKLVTLKDRLEEIADIGFEVAGRDPTTTVRKLYLQSLSGMDAVVGTLDGDDEIKAFLSFGDAKKSISWATNMPLMMELNRRGVWPLQGVDNVFIRKAFWKTGSQLALSRTAGQQMVSNGYEWMILYGYPTDEMNAYSMRQPGSEILEGFFDRNGRPVGLRHLPTYLEATN